MSLIYVMVGLLLGFVDSTHGMGFGVTSSTVLITFGITPAIASASVHAAETVVDLFSAAIHRKLGNVDNEIWLRMAVPGVLSTVLGASVLSR